MKTDLTQSLLAAALLLSAACSPLSALAQGTLTPPGAPAAGMKTLAQLESRTPISFAPFTISAPGSYYLTTNLTVSTGDGIDINTNNVTLDLNGYTIASTASSATNTGISLNSGWSDITIYNGHIRGGVTNNGSGVYGGGGFGFGINYSSTNIPANALVVGVSVTGCRYSGIILGAGSSTVADNCTVQTVGGSGIIASTVQRCSAMDCGSDAITGDEVSDCRGQCSVSGAGIYAKNNAQNCYGFSGSSVGLDGNTVLNCYGASNSGIGLSATTAQNCSGNGYGGSSGLTAVTAQNCHGHNYSGTGLSANYLASGCYGFSNYGTGLNAFIANICHGVSTFAIALSTGHNVNSF